MFGEEYKSTKNLFEKEILVIYDHCLVGFDSMYFDRLVLTFQWNLLPLSSEQKNLLP
jgi:hypothetical protein